MQRSTMLNWRARTAMLQKAREISPLIRRGGIVVNGPFTMVREARRV